MSVTKYLRALSLVGLIAAVAPACAPYGRGGVGIGLVFVEREPPPRRVEVVSVSPGPEYVWTSGFWAWRGREYEWVPGSWRRAEGGRREWVEAHWEHERRGWFFVDGHWR